MNARRTDAWFYQRRDIPLADVLAPLLGKTLEAGKRALVRLPSMEACKAVDGALWEWQGSYWLPHGAKFNLKHPEWAAHQPIYLTEDGADVPNGAEYLFRIDGAGDDDLARFERVFDIFSGQDAEGLAQARARWRQARRAEHSLSYWKFEDGKWRRQETGG